MGRRNTRGMELSFHKASKRWRKRVSGVDHYFGTGKGVSDRVGYQRALKAYKRWQAQQEEKTEAQAAYDDTMERLLQCTGQYTLPPNMPDLSKLMHYFQAGPPLTRDERIAQILSSPILSKLLEPLEDEQPTPKRSTLDEVFDAYIAQIDHRYSMSESNVATVNAKDRLGASMYRTLANSVKAVRGHFKTVGLTSLDDMTKVEAALRSFREQLDARVAKGEISGGYVYALIRSIRPMFTLAWENRIIPELPRCLSAISTKPRHEPQAKPLTKAQIHKLWAAGDDRMRCWVALGLNCGLYAVDISDIQVTTGSSICLTTSTLLTFAPTTWQAMMSSVTSTNTSLATSPATQARKAGSSTPPQASPNSLQNSLTPSQAHASVILPAAQDRCSSVWPARYPTGTSRCLVRNATAQHGRCAR